MLVGRALTAQWLPGRPDIHKVIEEQGKHDGRIGGQNVKPTLTPESIKRLEDLRVDLELFTARLQRKLVEGEMTVNIPEGATPPE